MLKAILIVNSTFKQRIERVINRLKASTRFEVTHAISYLYLCVTLPAVLVLCLLVSPFQVMDESRHFVRACQIVQGGWVSEMDPQTGRVGGMLPEAVGDFVRQRMLPTSLVADNAHPTIRQRLSALDRESSAQPPLTNKRFISFPSAAI